MSWRKITCEERDAIYYAERPEKLAPISSCTDLSAAFHSEPQMDITWGLASTDIPVLRETRYPPWEWEAPGTPDRKLCEHWEYEHGE